MGSASTKPETSSIDGNLKVIDVVNPEIEENFSSKTAEVVSKNKDKIPDNSVNAEEIDSVTTELEVQGDEEENVEEKIVPQNVIILFFIRKL